MTSRILWALLLTLPFAGACEDEPVLGERMLPEAEAVARSTLEAAEERPPQKGVPGTRIRIPASVQPAVAVLAAEHSDRECGPITIYFDGDSPALDEEARETLDAVAACLKGERGTPVARREPDPEDAEEYDAALARQRAYEVATYLRNEGVGEDVFDIVAVGERGATEALPRLYPRYRIAK